MSAAARALIMFSPGEVDRVVFMELCGCCNLQLADDGLSLLD